jgi:hypothetical protein
MNKYLLIALLLILAAVIAVVVVQHNRQPTQVPDLDAAAVETGKNLHPPTLNP